MTVGLRRSHLGWAAAALMLILLGSAGPAQAGVCPGPGLLMAGNPPSVSTPTATGTTDSLTIAATITPNEYSVTYQAVVTAPGYSSSTSPAVLSQCTGDVPVSIDVMGLSADTSYDVTVVIQSAAGTSSSSGSFETNAPTPSAPPFELRINVGRRALTVGSSVNITGQQGGAVPADNEGDPPLVYLQLGYGLHGPWFTPPSGENETYATARGRLTWTPQQPDRNTWFRIYMPPSVFPMRAASISRAVLVRVAPQVSLSVSRPHDTTEVSAVFTARVHLLTRYHGQLVFFYVRHGRSGPFRRFASAKLRYTDDYEYPELEAQATLNDANAGQVSTCTRHALLADMGSPFLVAACGRETIGL